MHTHKDHKVFQGCNGAKDRVGNKIWNNQLKPEELEEQWEINRK